MESRVILMGVAAYCQGRWNEKLPCKNIHEARLLILSTESLYEVRRGCYRDLARAAIAKKKKAYLLLLQVDFIMT
jgi:hypothetical protein